MSFSLGWVCKRGRRGRKKMTICFRKEFGFGFESERKRRVWVSLNILVSEGEKEEEKKRVLG